ncbi:MAG: Inner membrane protein YbaL, KefB/KefC family [uncultured Chthoniobacterales bacterium]|uniref:Inner membrane protein YbaL, KefB/KefC family n=1 Tax=uncultured Chthoniobacterales bacterium TaxID=1836801 RepID=A0A6J4HGH5_9BACT|nr:MAG: Inner membrane protein YbaL, KefB/KefC family [uncultured Chthoniobacterales bacterium]
MHDISLISTIALALSAALAFGLLAKRVGLSPIVGYLVAGVLIGPHTPGVVGDLKIAGQLAEMGVILLMFGVGLHFSLKELLAVRSIAVPGAIGQSAVATLACTGLAVAVGWTWQTGLILGLAVSIASTVVLLRVLMDHGSVNTPEGHASIGWLIVQDIIAVLVLVLLPPLAATAGDGVSLWQTMGIALLKLALLTAIVLLAGARFVPWLLLRVARLRSRELFTLTILVMAICVATVSYVAFGASMALGAFLGGMVVGQSKVSEEAAADLLPMRNVFTVLFFVSVGMLFDYRVLLESPALIAGVLAIVLLVTPLAAFTIVIAGGHSLRTGLTIAGGLAQIGEFSFIVGDMATSLRLLPGTGRNVLVGAAIVSISLNPFIFRGVLSLEPRLAKWPLLARWLAGRGQKLGARANEAMAHRTEDPGAIVVGYGPVGQTVTRLLTEFGINPMIIETNVDAVLELQQRGQQALFGDATRKEILRAAGLESAAYVVVTVPRAEISLRIVQAAREVAPVVRILTRAEYINGSEAFMRAGAAIIRYDEAESAAALAEALLQDIDVPADRIDALVGGIRKELSPARDGRKMEL